MKTIQKISESLEKLNQFLGGFAVYRIPRRWWRQFSIRRALVKWRFLWVLSAGAISFFLVAYFLTDVHFALDGSIWTTIDALRDSLRSQLAPSQSTQSTGAPAPMSNNAGAWSFMTLLAGSIIAFVLWWFRDTNTLWQIENQRKETNLKDFQKLAEWASGLHLVEDKETIQEKNTDDGSKKTETTTTRESSRLPENITRWEGSVSLQIAAVYQLQAFLRGDYGAHFKEPAFALLKSIWLSLMQNHVKAWDDKWFEAKTVNEHAFNAWKTAIYKTRNTPLARAIAMVLASNHGQYLRDHKKQLPRMCLAGLSTQLAGLKPLELDGLLGFDLKGINLQGAILPNVQLQNAELSYAQLQGASLWKAQLQGADLRVAQLQGANLPWAQLQEADLRGANIRGADFMGADLKEVQFQGATIQQTDFMNADLTGAKFYQSQLKYLKITDKQRASIVWEDDPKNP